MSSNADLLFASRSASYSSLPYQGFAPADRVEDTNGEGVDGYGD